jgi:hypothetical protein
MKKLILISMILANIVTAAQDPEDFVAEKSNKNSWFAYTVKAQDDTRSMCCWDAENKSQSSCNLNSTIRSYGTSDTSPITENINIYVKLKKGQVDTIIPMGDQCQVNTNGVKVSWLKKVTQQNSINWLKDNSLKNQDHNSLYALALHKDESASVALFDIASENNNNSENAVFWLGEVRIDGVEYLKKLYQTLPKGPVKRHINFALTQTKSPQGIELLKQIASEDKDVEQRGDALFWIGQSNQEGIIQVLLKSINNDPSHKVKEKAIFSLSQIKTDQAIMALLDIAKNNKNEALQNKALFWLAQVSPIKAREMVLKILEQGSSEDRIENAVFTLSQLSQSKDEALFQLISGNYSKQVKKQALFWLSQSDNTGTIDKLQKLL